MSYQRNVMLRVSQERGAPPADARVRANPGMLLLLCHARIAMLPSMMLQQMSAARARAKPERKSRVA